MSITKRARKCFLLAVLGSTFVVPAVAVAQTPSPQHLRQYDRTYRAVASKFGTRAPGRNIHKDGTTGGRATDAQIVRSLGVLDRMLHPVVVVVQHSAPAVHRSTIVQRTDGDGDHDGDTSDAPSSVRRSPAPVQRGAIPIRAPAATQSATPAPQSTSSGGGLSSVPGVPAGFAGCVAMAESTNGTNPAAHGNVYGIIPSSGYNVAGMSVAQQKQVFSRIYHTVGASAWAPHDGC